MTLFKAAEAQRQNNLHLEKEQKESEEVSEVVYLNKAFAFRFLLLMHHCA